MDYDAAFADLNKALVDLDGDGKPDAVAPRAKLGANRLEPGEVPVQPEDTSSWWDRVKAAWASGGWQDPQPGQRGTFVPSRINEQGKAEPAVPGIIQQPAEGLYGLMTSPLSDIVRSGDRDAMRAASEASFDVASMLPAAGVAAGRTMPTNAAGMGGGKLDPPLPMDKASRMARAKEMGFNTDTTWYHGTAEKFDAFDPATIGDNFRADERGFFFSNVPSIADGYAMSDSVGLPREGGNVIPAHLRMENPLIVDEMRLNREGMHGVLGKTEDPIGFWDNYQGLLNEWADAQKADGIVIVDPSYKVPNGPNKGQSSMMAVSFDPSRIRSVNAAFDPAKKNSANLLASNPDDINTSAILAAMQAQDKPKGITAYHGSPHDFDKFDLSKIGTGEGAQAYGHGLYFAENEGVARSYRDQLASGVMPGRSAAVGHHQMVASKPPYNGDVAAYVQDMRALMEQKGPDALANFESIAPLIEGKAPGRMYEVRINADPNDFLDWDKPLSQQSEKVRGAVDSRLSQLREAGAKFSGDPAGDTILRAMHPQGGLDQTDWSLGPAAQATKNLRDAGIPGIRYLDQGSRVAGEGSRNYVVFDDALVEILRKYANAPDPTTAAILALLTAQQGAQPQQ